MMKLKKKFIFTMVFLPAVMLSFMGSGPFGPLTCPGPTMDIWEATLEEFEAGAASMKSTELTNGEHWVNLDVREDEWPSDCFERIAAVLKQNPYKSSKIFMKDKKIADTLSALPEKAFENCKGQLFSLHLPLQITCIGKRAFAGFTGLGHVEIGAQIKEVGDEAYKDCTGGRIFIYYIPEKMGKNVFEGWTDKQRFEVNFERGILPTGWDEDWASGCKADIKYKGEH